MNGSIANGISWWIPDNVLMYEAPFFDESALAQCLGVDILISADLHGSIYITAATPTRVSLFSRTVPLRSDYRDSDRLTT